MSQKSMIVIQESLGLKPNKQASGLMVSADSRDFFILDMLLYVAFFGLGITFFQRLKQQTAHDMSNSELSVSPHVALRQGWCQRIAIPCCTMYNCNKDNDF